MAALKKLQFVHTSTGTHVVALGFDPDQDAETLAYLQAWAACTDGTVLVIDLDPNVVVEHIGP